MKARLPQGYSSGAGNLQQLARQAQKMQEDMEKLTAELEQKEYSATSGGNAVKVVVNGKMEMQSIKIQPEVVDKDDVEMLEDLIMAAVNEAVRLATDDKNKNMEKMSGSFNMPGLF